jgi:hypothetical protein
MKKKSNASLLPTLRKVKDEGSDFFIVQISRNSPNWQMDIEYYLKANQFAVLIDYLEKMSIKSSPPNRVQRDD